MERKLVLESCLTSGRLGLLEMCVLLTDDIVEFNLDEFMSYKSTLSTQLTFAMDIKLTYRYHQDAFLSLLIVKCPVSISVSNKTFHFYVRNMPTFNITSPLCQYSRFRIV